MNIDRTVVENKILMDLEKIKEANQLQSIDDVYDHLIENWYMFNAHWLSIVMHIKESGRLQ